MSTVFIYIFFFTFHMQFDDITKQLLLSIIWFIMQTNLPGITNDKLEILQFYMLFMPFINLDENYSFLDMMERHMWENKGAHAQYGQ